MRGHNCDCCGAPLPESAFSGYGSWSYNCPVCSFQYRHGSVLTLDEQLSLFDEKVYLDDYGDDEDGDDEDGDDESPSQSMI